MNFLPHYEWVIARRKQTEGNYKLALKCEMNPNSNLWTLYVYVQIIVIINNDNNFLIRIY